jgi:hypothetical protein
VTPASIPFTFGDEVMIVPVVRTSSVPPERVIAPRFKVLLALAADTDPAPTSTVFAKACVKASLRLTVSLPLPSASVLAGLIEPTVPPAPIASVPDSTLVVPV